jgi:hypothetical protein
MLVVVEINQPEPPAGQHFLLRGHLRQVFDRAPLTGDAWGSCVNAFLAFPGVPALVENATTQAPASFFRRLFEPRPGDVATATPVWNSLSETPLTVRRFNCDKLDVSVDLTDESGASFTVRFGRAFRARFPEPRNEKIRRLVEVSGFQWPNMVMFAPVDGNNGRVLAVQAPSASWLRVTT